MVFFILGILASFFFISIATLSKFCSIRSLFISITFCSHVCTECQSGVQSEVVIAAETIVKKIHKEINEMRDLSINSSPETLLPRYSAFLSGIVRLIESLKTTGNPQENSESELSIL